MNNANPFVPKSIQSRKNPFLSVQSELDRAMADFYNSFVMPYNSFSMPTVSSELFENLTITPSINLVEDKDSFKVEAEMPGLGEEDVKVSISDGVLTVKGEKTVSTKNDKKNYLSREIHYGRYERSVALPDSVDVEKAKASFKKGMLWVTMPKRVESIKKSRELKVEKA